MISTLSVNMYAGKPSDPSKPDETPTPTPAPTPVVEDDLFLVSTSTEELKPGDETTIYFEQDNPGYRRYYNYAGDYEIYSVRATSDSPNNCYVINSYGGMNGAEVRVRIPQSAEAGTYRISLVGKAKRRGARDGAPVKVEGEAYVRVNGGSQNKAQLKITRVDILPEANIVPGSYVAFGYEIENISDVLAKNVELNISGLAAAGLSVKGGTTTQKVKTIESGKKIYLYYELNVAKTAKFGS